MGRISDLIPPLYFGGKNGLEGFVNALDAEIEPIERKIRGIPELIDVDMCPDDKLPYLAALTNCPLAGENAALQRRQLRDWPYLLKIKGTALSFEVYLNSIGAVEHRIPTYFRDAEGNYVEEKPEGEPFLGEDGIWYNIRTHYFGLETYWEGEAYLRREDWNTDFAERVSFWLKRMKPFHAELLKWITYVRQNEMQTLYTGIANFEGSVHNIGLPTPDREPKIDTQDRVGIGFFQGQIHSIMLPTPSVLPTALRCWCGVTCAVYISVGVDIPSFEALKKDMAKAAQRAEKQEKVEAEIARGALGPLCQF